MTLRERENSHVHPNLYSFSGRMNTTVISIELRLILVDGNRKLAICIS
jgi:hypothetical protein